MSSSNNDETILLITGIAATLQLCRWAMDLIATASQKDAEKDRKLEQASREELRASLLSKSKHNKSNKNKSSLFLRPSSQVLKKRNSGDSDSNSSSENKKEKTPDNTEETNNNETTTTPILNPLETKLSWTSLAANALFSLYFTVLCILGTTTTTTSASLSATFSIVDPIALGCTAVFFWLALWTQGRDRNRIRFSKLQRGFHLLGSIMLAVGIIVWIPTYHYNDNDDDDTTILDIVSMVLTAAYAVLAVAECRFIRWPNALVKEKESTKKARLTMKAFLTVLKPYFWPAATATSATINRIRALATWAFVIASKATGLLAPVYIGRASTALTQGRYEDSIRNTCWYCLLTLASAVFKEGQSLVYLRVAQAAFVQLAELSFRHLHSLSLDWHLQKKLGEVIRSMDRGILACDTLVKYLFLFLIPAIAECILVVVIFATYFNYLPLAVTVFYFVFAYMLLTILLTLWRKKFRKQVTKSDNDWHDIATDSLVNFETVKYFTAEDIEMHKFGTAVKAFQKGSVSVAASLSALNISQRILLQACLATALSLSALAIQDRMECCMENGCDNSSELSQCCSEIGRNVCPGMEIGDFVTVLTYTLNLFMPLNFLGSVYNALVMAVVDLTNLSELLAEDPDIADAKDPVDLPSSNPNDPETVVEFDNVRFHYPSQPETSGLKGVSFQMKRGTTTAIVGPTGAGKTTISRLLFRFYDTTGGAIKVNGKDVRMVRQKDLRSIIGVVPQSATLFNDTFGANIAYGKPGAPVEEIAQAAQAAQLTTFVESLPNKWDTLVGDRGLKLSGGERQRCAIARCILKNPPICIFDEATSALDTITEASVKEALERLGSDRTVLVIAHRLGTIKNADNIVVLVDGMVFEQGTHDELLAKGGKYADMWNMQLHATKTSDASLVGLNSEI